MDKSVSPKKGGLSAALGTPSPWERSSMVLPSAKSEKVSVTYRQASPSDLKIETEAQHLLAVINPWRRISDLQP